MIGINIKTAYFTLLSHVPMFKVTFCDLDSLATVLDVYFNINIGFFSKFSITEWNAALILSSLYSVMEVSFLPASLEEAPQ